MCGLLLNIAHSYMNAYIFLPLHFSSDLRVIITVLGCHFFNQFCVFSVFLCIIVVIFICMFRVTHYAIYTCITPAFCASMYSESFYYGSVKKAVKVKKALRTQAYLIRNIKLLLLLLYIHVYN